MSVRKKILFLSSSKSSFITQDIEILKKYFDVQVLIVNQEIHDKNIFSVSSFFLKYIRLLIWSDTIFCWFATNPAYLAVRLSRLLKKKSVVIIGGGEVANETKIEYGTLRNKTLAKRIAYTISNADKIIAVSKFSRKEIENVAKPREIQLLYNTVDVNKFSKSDTKGNIVSTICIVNNENIKRKGLITFLEAAKNIPNAKFVLIGKITDDSIDHLQSIAPTNVEFTGFLPDHLMIDLLHKSKVYCQLSYYESFGVAIAESMACGCIPVITERGAMHEITGDIGYKVPYGDVEATAEAIKKALKSQDGDKARKRIEENFNSKTRERELINMINNL